MSDDSVLDEESLCEAWSRIVSSAHSAITRRIIHQRTLLEPSEVILPLEIPLGWFKRPELFRSHILSTLEERLKKIHALALSRNRVIDEGSFGNLDLAKYSYRQTLGALTQICPSLNIPQQLYCLPDSALPESPKGLWFPNLSMLARGDPMKEQGGEDGLASGPVDQAPPTGESGLESKDKMDDSQGELAGLQAPTPTSDREFILRGLSRRFNRCCCYDFSTKWHR